MMKELEQLPIPLLLWYRENARVLPWRSDPTPYRVWISEIMLQQTRVAAVLDYYRRFLEAVPTVADLAALPEDALMKLWQGLGYYSRASKRPPARSWRTSAEYSQILMMRSALWPGWGTIPRGQWPPSPSDCRSRRWMETSCGW